jgi:serine/threonine-protein kinase
MMTKITTTTIIPSQANSTTESSLTYENPIYGIRIQYPSDWEKLEFIQGRSGFNVIVILRSPPENTSDTKLENLVIQIGNLPSENVSLGEVVSMNINSLKQSLIDFELNESTTITIDGGNPAHKIVYTEREENNELSKVMQVLMIKSDKIYLITYIAEQRKYDSYLPTIQNMIDSFEFITPQIIGKTT